MNLRNKRSGEIVKVVGFDESCDEIKMRFVNEKNEGRLYITDSLTTFNSDWEDYKEPKVKKHDFYYINENGGVLRYVPNDPDGEDLSYMKHQEEIGNHFKTREEAEKAVEKLKAVKRLKDKGIKFNLDFVKNNINFTYRIDGTLYSSAEEARIIFNDMKLLFSGGEDE